MKKLIASLLMAVMVLSVNFSLTGCGKGDYDADKFDKDKYDKDKYDKDKKDKDKKAKP